MRHERFLITLVLGAAAMAAHGQIYKWTDEQGHVHFGDHPAGNNHAQVVTSQVNTYSGVEVTRDDSLGSAPAEKHPSVRMYSASWCGVCKQARAYFVTNHIPFTEFDVEQSDKGRRDFKSLHGSGVPIILVGKQRMNGFDAGSFEAMYSGV